MRITCTQCRRTLEFSGERPSFCGYCGSRLSSVPLDATLDFDPDAATWTPENGGGGGIALSAPPTAIGGYRLVRPLGSGGMGTVYEAENSNTGQLVALKLISAEVAMSADGVERFRQEGRLASTIAHPRCVFVLAADEEAGRPYIVMELMTGSTLKELVDRQGPLAPEDAIRKILDIIDGLQEAHQLGVVHRDVKPSNCFLEPDGRVKIGDFGLAKSLSRSGHLTRTGAFLGTPLFASPEQIRGEEVDPQSDVYSVAATLYFLLTGQAPFEQVDAAATLARIVSEPASSMRALRLDVPPALDRVVLKGLERDRETRWRDLEQFRAALLPLLPGRLSMGSMGLRFGAYLIDWLLFSPLGIFLQPAVIAQQLGDTESRLMMAAVISALGVLPMILYFSVLEGIWGCSLGKRLLRLRVFHADGSGPPGVAKASLRALLFYVFIGLAWTLTEIWVATIGARDTTRWEILGTSLSLSGLLIMVSTMRASNGYRGLHELLSGTRVVRLPWPQRRRTYPTRPLSQNVDPLRGLPERLGQFTVEGALSGTGDDTVLLGEDSVLGRKAWILYRDRSRASLPEARRQTSRATRLRWLAYGEEGDMQWDAFVAPTGSQLPELIEREGRLSWSDARPLLEQLTDELAAGCADGTVPPILSPEQVWIQPNGRLYLLAVAPGYAPGEGHQDQALNDDQRALVFLRQVTRLMLEGKRESPTDAASPIRAPVPLHAAQMLRSLTDADQGYTSVEELQADLAATRDQPTEIDTATRAGHLGILGAALCIPLIMMALSSRAYSIAVAESLDADVVRAKAMLRILEDEPLRREVAEQLKRAELFDGTDIDPQKYREAIRTRLDADEQELTARVHSFEWSEWLRIELFFPEYTDRRLKLVALGEEPVQVRRANGGATVARVYRCSDCRTVQHAQDLTLGDIKLALEHPSHPPYLYRLMTLLSMFFFICLVPLVWMIWAFITRGGLSYRLAGISLLRANGQKALRIQCAWRAFLVWAPVTLLLLLSVLADALAPQREWLGRTLWWSALALLLVYVVLALRYPSRSLHDRLAGTYLVPR